MSDKIELSIFTAIRDHTILPRPGDLIRSRNTGDIINIVREVEHTPRGLLIRSTRYARIHNSEINYLGGHRSRAFIWKPYIGTSREGKWEIVKEGKLERLPVTKTYKKVTLRDDSAFRADALKVPMTKYENVRR